MEKLRRAGKLIGIPVPMGRPTADSIFYQRLGSPVLIRLAPAAAEPHLAGAHGFATVIVASASISVQARHTGGRPSPAPKPTPLLHLVESGFKDARGIRYLDASGSDYAD